MKASIITTLDTPSLMLQTDYHLVLAQHLREPTSDYYRTVEACIERGDFVILDNGAAEEWSMGSEELVRLAVTLGVSEVVAPDILRHGEESFDLTHEFMENWAEYLRARKHRPIHIMAVPQGVTVGEWFFNLDRLLNDYRIDTIGIPKNLDKTGIMRAMVVELMSHEYLLNPTIPMGSPTLGKEFHLLGSSQWVGEIAYVAERHRWVRGIDSAYPVALARQGKLYLGHEMRDESVGSFHEDSGPNFDLAIAEQNIDAYLNLARHTKTSSG